MGVKNNNSDRVLFFRQSQKIIAGQLRNRGGRPRGIWWKPGYRIHVLRLLDNGMSPRKVARIIAKADPSRRCSERSVRRVRDTRGEGHMNPFPHLEGEERQNLFERGFARIKPSRGGME